MGYQRLRIDIIQAILWVLQHLLQNSISSKIYLLLISNFFLSAINTPINDSNHNQANPCIVVSVEKICAMRKILVTGATGFVGYHVAKKAVENGIANIHINTEVRLAYREGLDEKLKEAPGETTPYKFLEGAVEKMREVVEEKVKIFLNL